MIRLHALLRVLNYNLNKRPELRRNHVRSYRHRRAGCRWLVANQVVFKNSPIDPEILSELKRHGGVGVRDGVERKAKLSVNGGGGAGELDGPGDVDLSVVVRALRVGPGRAGR